ncbi:DMT family transporter [Pseudoruegeria sp. HB172150]|uniref:EamA family transporter n=1 Tax=Pseudoruegeria sp. HB172150 TaxID=2721164 RepID=UPI0020A69DE7|nr:EamA family transporter [Pseudoruegeria sp. HB172150]
MHALPPHAWFAVSAVFHYLGPSFAVLLFPAAGPLGTAFLRVASAAAVFAPVTRPRRSFARADIATRRLLIVLGLTLAAMNTSFYLALERLPMSLVAAMEFTGTIGLALYGLRTRRNLAALALTVAGVFLLIGPAWSGNLPGLAWSALNAALFTLYVVLGHRAAQSGAAGGIERLGAAMAVAALALLPLGIATARTLLESPVLVAAGIGVGICSSVIPYICDQLAMARLPRASFALLLAMLPATATVVAVIVLAQIPGPADLGGIALVMGGIALHRPAR